MEITKRHIIGIIAALVVLIADFFMYFVFFKNLGIFYFIIVIALIIAASPFVLSIVLETKKEKENNEMFLEFSRNLVENVKAGTPISKGIINLKDKFYGTLTPHIKKLANQISIGIPVKEAFEIFARDVKSNVVTRAVTLISEAEKAGGEIEGILESVAKSVGEVEELKKQRQSSIYGMVVQGYIIFFVFIAIMLIIQFMLLPRIAEIPAGGLSLGEMGEISQVAIADEAARPMFLLLLVQGLFTGLIIGKLAEESFRAGIKHSFIMIAISLLVYTGTQAFF